MDVRERVSPHCAEHSHYVEGCSVCQRALANSLPYPVKKMAAPIRSFGQTGEITAATFGDPRKETDGGASLGAIRFILRLIWPFSRII